MWMLVNLGLQQFIRQAKPRLCKSKHIKKKWSGSTFPFHIQKKNKRAEGQANFLSGDALEYQQFCQTAQATKSSFQDINKQLERKEFYICYKLLIRIVRTTRNFKLKIPISSLS